MDTSQLDAPLLDYLINGLRGWLAQCRWSTKNLDIIFGAI